MSNDQRSEGLANSSGLVGKNLMLHPIVPAIGLFEEDIEGWYGPAGQIMYSMQFADTDRSRGFLRGAKWALMPPLGALHVLDHVLGLPFDERWGNAIHAVTEYTGRSTIWSATLDDLPEISNEVVLDSEARDSSGLPGVKLNYRRSANTNLMVEFMYQRMMEAHMAAGAVRSLRAPLTESGHLLGTARMGNDPATSVVNRFGQTHDVPNLYISDGSVMVTGGSVNPTATIAALSLRTATHVAETARHAKVAL
jgi:choline dehydrogenase-like flavoprotein